MVLVSGRGWAGSGPCLLCPELLPFQCACSFCSSTDRCLIWLSVPPSLNRWCKGAWLGCQSLCLPVYGLWYPEKGCRPDGQESPELSEADAASACRPHGQLPVDQEVACLLAASQLVMFHNLWETSWNKEFCKQSRRNCHFLGVTPTGILFNDSLGPFVGFILFISIDLNLHFMSDFFMGL